METNTYIFGNKNGHDTHIKDVQGLVEYIISVENVMDVSVDGRITLKGTGK